MSASVFTPTCSVVICTRNRPAELEKCLAGVMATDYPRFDVIVVDNAPTDTETQQIALRWRVRYLVEPVPGLNRARNLGARSCQAEIVVYTDDDAIPEPGWLKALMREFEDPAVMVVTGKIVASRTDTEAQRLSAKIGGAVSGLMERRIVDRMTPSWFELANFGGIGHGANMAFRRTAFDTWPGFDERLGTGSLLDGSGEHCAFFSLIDAGYRAVYTPDAIVRHPLPKTMSDLRARCLKDIASSTGYIGLLFLEQRYYRRAILKYVLEALRGTPRKWRGPFAETRPRIVSRRQKVFACLHGAWLCLRSQVQNPAARRSRLTKPQKV